MRKWKILLWLSNKEGEDGQRIADRMGTTKVQFVPIDFNKDDIQQKLASHESFRSNVTSVITLEGVTQYIPKERTADTLKKLGSIISPGSTILVTYVDEKCMGDIKTLPRQFRWVRNLAAKSGEPWISGWSKEEFEKFINECGYEVASDTSQEDYNETYLKEVGRQLHQDDLLSMERFVFAKKR